MVSSLKERIIPDTYEELRYMIGLFDTGKMPMFHAGMKQHFIIAKRKPECFLNHETVLAISIGGSNTKVMLTSMENGKLTINYIRTLKNPDVDIALYDYLDNLILEDEAVNRYLKTARIPLIGISLPMAIIEKCPYHATKLPTIKDLVARSPEQICPEMNFGANFDNYMHLRGFSKKYKMFYQADGIVAHHGAVSLIDVKEGDKTVLCICGTGMANGDEENFLPLSLLCLLKNDDELFPNDETENRQLNYAIAGKGLFGLMRRCIQAKIRMGGSLLEGKNIERYFISVNDSKTVFDIWTTLIDNQYKTVLTDEILAVVNPEGYRELQEISELIVTRVYETLSNLIISTFVYMGPVKTENRNILFLEGSIAANSYLAPLIKQDIIIKTKNKEFFINVHKPMLLNLSLDEHLKPLQTRTNIKSEDLKKADITLIGAATIIMAQDCAENNIPE